MSIIHISAARRLPASLLAAFLLVALSACTGASPGPEAATAAAPGSATAPAKATATVYSCPMHPHIQQHGPGQCPICGMDLQKREVAAGVAVSAAVVQSLGIRTATPVLRDVRPRVRVPARVVADARGQARLQARVDGWIERLLVRAVGQPVAAGSVVAEIYAPELVQAQEELLLGPDTAGPARERLRRLGIADADIERVRRSGSSMRRLPLRAPVAGVVTELGVREGSRVTPETLVVDIAGRNAVWIEAQLFPAQRRLLGRTFAARFTLPGSPGEAWSSASGSLVPVADAITQTLAVRFAVGDAADLPLGTVLDAEIDGDARTGVLLVPASAVIRTSLGDRVLVERAPRRFVPTEVTLGQRYGEEVEIRDGLAATDRIVVSGQFLLDAEASLQAGLAQMQDAAAGGFAMIARVIQASLAHRGWVLAITLLVAIASVLSVRQLPLDAIPDLSDVQVIIRTAHPGQAPQVVEDQVTYPITTRMLAVPRAKAVRGFSMYGDSFVYVLFEDGTDLYWARSRVLEYLSQVRSELPAGIDPQLGPDATGVGWVYQYALVDRSGRNDLATLRSLQDWRLRFELQRVPGVAEVASVGGFVRQYEAVVDPRRLQAYGIGFNQLLAAIRSANRETSGARLEMAESEYVVRGVGYIRSLQDLGAVPTGVLKDGKAILLRDVAELRFGPAPRNGIAELDGEGEAVGGIIVMRDGANAKAVIDAVRQRLATLGSSLPPGVEIVPVYDRSGLIDRAVGNLRGKLLQELLLVSLVCALFLWHARSALVAVVSLPLGVLVALAIMRWQGLNANIMSLGGIAIAIGAMVDAAVVMIENAHKHLEDWASAHGGKPAEGDAHWRVIAAAALEVGPALFFSLLIAALSFLPVFMLQAQEGRMFAPLAWTKTWALAVAAGLSITLVPVLMGYWIRGRFTDESGHRLTRWITAGYRPLLGFALRRPGVVVLLAVLGLASAALPASRLGSEFMPELEEGDVLYMPTTLPGLSPGQALAVLQRTDRIIKSVPEVASVFGKAGRAETATDPAPLTMLETTVQFKPEAQWRPGMTRDKLLAELQQKLALPGLTGAWVPPILNRINMQVSGIRTPLGVRVSGPDLASISRSAERIAQVLSQVPGTRSAFAERAADARQIDVVPDRELLARHAVTMEDAQALLASAIGGEAIGRAVEGRERYPIALRTPQAWRDSPEAIAALPVVTPSGAQLPLGALATVRLSEGPPMIRSEDAQLATYVFVDLDEADLGRYIARAEQALQKDARLAEGVSWRWAGSYEHLQRAGERLRLAVPLTLLIVFGLLYAAFRRVAEASLVMLTLPFALVGGLWLLWALGYAYSVAVAVGFIALAGVAAEFGVVMLIYLDAAVTRARAAGHLSTVDELDAALREGALRRVRPKLMTVVTIVVGLLPIAFASGAGAATMQRIAAPMIGGMLSAPLLSLVVIPAVYKLWLRRRLPKANGAVP